MIKNWSELSFTIHRPEQQKGGPIKLKYEIKAGDEVLEEGSGVFTAAGLSKIDRVFRRYFSSRK